MPTLSTTGIDPTKDDRYTAVRWIGATMCFVVAIGGALAELALAWIWLFPDYVQTMVVPHLGLGDAPVALDFQTRFIGFAISMLPLAVLFYALHQAYDVFDAYRLGNLFAPDVPQRLRKIGLSMVGLAVLRPIASMLIGIVLTMGNPPGQKMLAIGFGIDDYMIATFGGLILAIGHVMVEAKRLADDNSQIV